MDKSEKEIQQETIDAFNTLQRLVGVLFPWKMPTYKEISMDRSTIEYITNVIKTRQEEIEELTLIVRQLRKGE